MIELLKSTDKGFVSIKNIESHCWVNVSNPSQEEIQSLSKELNIPLDFLTDSLDIDERSRIETEDNTTLIVLRIPKFDNNNHDIPFTTLPVGIVLVKDVVITVCLENFTSILNLFNGKIKKISTQNRSHFILYCFHETAILYLKYLKDIYRRTNKIETELHVSMKNEALIKLLNIEKSLVFFATSLKSNELVMERLQKIGLLELNDEDKDLLEDVIIDNKQAIEMANIYSNILSGMMDAFASVISNNLNMVMKFLTSVTIILMIPTLIASIYGMNVNIPFQHSPHAFFITIGISFILSAIITLFFLRKKWF